LRQDVNDAWNVLGTHGFDIPLRIQGGKVHEVVSSYDTFAKHETW
jgi:hypothetical protein